jgi:hypothetical protein
MALTKELADAVREKVRVVNVNTLRSAMFAMVQHARKAAADEADNPGDQELGWYADAAESMVEIVWATIGDGAEVRGRGAPETAGRHEGAADGS